MRLSSFLTFLYWMCVCLPATCLAEATPLRVGMELAYPPFEMADPQGEPTGISVDLARALGEALGRPIEIKNLPFDGLIPSLKTGKIDLILSSMTATPERSRAIDFSEPYLRTGLCLLVGTRSSIESAADLDQPGRLLAVKQGTTGHVYATQKLRSAKTLVLDRESACVLEVAQGKAHAFLYDQMSVLKHWQQNPTTTRALLNPIQEEAWAIGLRKGQDSLRESVNRFLREFREKGGFKGLAAKWLPEQQAAFEKMGVPFVF
jgi:polar amino acid transport system substrate-binding protein